MVTVARAADAAQFLTLVPELCGFTPRQSLVVVPFSGGHSRGALRIDLPDRLDESVCDQLAKAAIDTVGRMQSIDAVSMVIYTDADFGDSPPGARLVDRVRHLADDAGLRLIDALTVAADGWGSHFDPDTPAGGHASVTLAHRFDQLSGAELPITDASDCAAVALALDSLTGVLSRQPTSTRTDPAALVALADLDDLSMLFEKALRWQPQHLSTYQAALICWCLSRPSLRDIALMQWSHGMESGDAALAAQLEWDEGAEYPADMARTMWGEGERPAPDRLETALALARHTAALSPRESRPGPLAAAAWLSWALGRSSHTSVYAKLALDIEPDHGLAAILQSFVYAGHLPAWAFHLV